MSKSPSLSMSTNVAPVPQNDGSSRPARGRHVLESENRRMLRYSRLSASRSRDVKVGQAVVVVIAGADPAVDIQVDDFADVLFNVRRRHLEIERRSRSGRNNSNSVVEPAWHSSTRGAQTQVVPADYAPATRLHRTGCGKEAKKTSWAHSLTIALPCTRAVEKWCAATSDNGPACIAKLAPHVTSHSRGVQHIRSRANIRAYCEFRHP